MNEPMPPQVKDQFPETWDTLAAYADMLAEEGELRGLIGPRELPRLWSRHILNCTAINGFIDDGASVADVGSGAGLPGIVLAITRPDLEVTLIETMERRTDWLHDVVDSLVLENVRVIRARAEEVHGKEQFEVVTARAVAALDKLMRWTMPLLRPGGALVALKGERAQEELEAALKVRRKFKITESMVKEVPALVGDEIPTRVVVIRKP